MYLIEDSRQQAGKHEIKHNDFAAAGDTLIRCALSVGDYALPPAVSVDTKASLSEIATNIGTPKDHKRFRAECQKAQSMGTHLYVLVENTDGITSLQGVADWKNPRRFMSPKAIDGERLCRAMLTMQERYGVTFVFCRPEQAAGYIKAILERGI